MLAFQAMNIIFRRTPKMIVYGEDMETNRRNVGHPPVPGTEEECRRVGGSTEEHEWSEGGMWLGGSEPDA